MMFSNFFVGSNVLNFDVEALVCLLKDFLRSQKSVNKFFLILIGPVPVL